MVVKGGKPLHGTIPISGAKNAALPILAACLLSEKPLTVKNIPFLSDITCMLALLREMGVDIHMDGTEAQEGHLGRVLKLSAAHIQSKAAPYELVRKMRASILVLGPKELPIALKKNSFFHHYRIEHHTILIMVF